jgi:hypothetical protein
MSLLAAPYSIENPNVISRKSVDRGVLQHARLANATAKQLKFRLSHHRYAGEQHQQIGFSRPMTWSSAVRPRVKITRLALYWVILFQRQSIHTFDLTARRADNTLSTDQPRDSQV